MSKSRKLEQVAQRKLIDNLEQVAVDMIDYVTNLQKVRELVELIGQVDNEYNGPRKSWLWGWLYAFYRIRAQDINSLVATLNQSGSSETLLDAIVQFFSSGGWDSTSANTNLMYKIIARLPGYSHSDPDPKISLTPQNIERLKDLFIMKACALLMPEHFVQTKKSTIKEELRNLPKRDVRQAADELLVSFPQLAPKMPLSKPQRGDKLDTQKFAKLKQELELVLKQRLNQDSGTEQNHHHSRSVKEGAEMKYEVKKLDPAKIRELDQKLGHMMDANAVLANSRREPSAATSSDDEEAYVVPQAPPAFSPAAFEVNAEANKGPYVALPRNKLVLNDKQLGAMNRLFAAKPEVKKEQEQPAEKKVASVSP